MSQRDEIAFPSLFHHRVLKVIEDLLEALETKETRYICYLWLTTVTVCPFPPFSLCLMFIPVLSAMNILITFISVWTGSPRASWPPRCSWLDGYTSKLLFWVLFWPFCHFMHLKCVLCEKKLFSIKQGSFVRISSHRQAFYFLCWHCLFCLQGNDGQPGHVGPPGPPGEKVRLPSENLLSVCHYCRNPFPLACRSKCMCDNSGY